MREHFLPALGMDEQQRARMRGLGSPRLLARDGGVHRAAALQKHNILLRELLFDIRAEVAVRDEQDLSLIHI